MEEIDYSRQKALPLRSVGGVAVVGLGGVGFWASLMLAMSGAATMCLFDDDILEPSNLNRLMFSTDDIGRPKNEALAELLFKLRPSLKVSVFGKADDVSLECVLPHITTLIDCTDKWKTQIHLSQYCKQKGKQYLRVGYDGTHVTITDSVAEFSVGDDDDDAGGYRIQPSWVVPSAIAGALGVMKLLYAPELDISCDIAEGFRPERIAYKVLDGTSLLNVNLSTIAKERWGVGYHDAITGSPYRFKKCIRCGLSWENHSGIWCRDEER